MKIGEFSIVLVPIEFTTSAPGDAVTDEVLERTDAGITAIGPDTVQALELAARLACGGLLLLVHARSHASEHATWTSAEASDGLAAKARQRVTGMLRIAARRHCPAVEAHYFVEAGEPLEVILRITQEHAPAAIVLAASSRGRLNRAFHGSTADKLIRRAPCPVVVLPSNVV